MRAKIERLECCVRELACQLACGDVDAEPLRMENETLRLENERLRGELDKADDEIAKLHRDIEYLTKMNDALAAM